MHPITALAFAASGAGIAIAFVVARRHTPRIRWALMLSFLDIALAIALMVCLVVLAITGVKLGLWKDGNETATWSLAMPLVSTPAYWVATLLGLFLPRQEDLRKVDDAS